MRAIIWAAVSTKPQLKGRDPEKEEEEEDEEEADDSLARQVKEGQAACDRFGWEVAATLEVPGHTRSYIFFQDAAEAVSAYREFQQLAESKAADVLVCRGRDRLGRTDALVAQVEALARQAGMQIYSLAMPTFVPQEKPKRDRGTIYAAAIERASAEAELVELRRRHQMGMRARIRKGLPPGKPPYGYRKQGNNPVPVQVLQEARNVRKMAELYLKGWGYSRIAGYLNNHDISPPETDDWRSHSVYKILHNDFYVGIVSYGETEARGKHEPIFSTGQWARIQKEHKRRKVTRGRSCSAFSGLVKCCKCGHSLSKNACRRKLSDGYQTYIYFRCHEGTVRGLENRGEAHHNQIKVETLKKAVVEKAHELQNPDRLKAACADRAAEEREKLEKTKVDLENALGELRSYIKRLIADHVRWKVATDEFDSLMAEATEQKGKLQQDLAQVTMMLEEMPPAEVRKRRLFELATDVEAILGDDVDPKEANAWLSQRIKAIWVRDGKVEQIELA